jgi:uncharacterized membrane protein
MMLRLLRHLFTPYFLLRRRYRPELLAALEARIVAIEHQHPGELRFAIEHALEPGDILASLSPRERALEVFSLLRVWDTEYNTGVLLYVLHADRAVEIVADRGMAHSVPQAEWDALCRKVEAEFRAGRYGEASLALVDGAAQLLETYYPPRTKLKNELPDQPLLL